MRDNLFVKINMRRVIDFFCHTHNLASARRRQGLFLFGIKKTSVASLSTNEKINTSKKTKNAG